MMFLRVHIIAAGNRPKMAVARTMSSALANRFCHLELRSDTVMDQMAS